MFWNLGERWHPMIQITTQRQAPSVKRQNPVHGILKVLIVLTAIFDTALHAFVDNATTTMTSLIFDALPRLVASSLLMYLSICCTYAGLLHLGRDPRGSHRWKMRHNRCIFCIAEWSSGPEHRRFQRIVHPQDEREAQVIYSFQTKSSRCVSTISTIWEILLNFKN